MTRVRPLQIVPQVEFQDLESLTEERKDRIKKRGCVLVRNVVERDVAAAWKDELARYVKTNPVEGEWKPDP